METGTGKTYVYTKTIYELHRRYGLTKFIIVVPSVAIREGVYKSFQITADHFGAYYDNVPCRYFIYNSAKLSDVRQFATSSNIEIMIINIDAFKKAENIIDRPKGSAQLEAGTLDLSEHHSHAKQRAILQIAQRANTKVVVRDVSKEVTVRLKKQVMLSPEFLEIWDRIKQKTTYRVQIDHEQLTANCLKDFANMPAIPKARIVTQTADMDIQAAGVTYMESGLRTIDLKDDYESLPDILQVISTETLLKRSDVGHILRQSGRGIDFLNNPQAFTEKAMEIISRNRHSLAIDGIRYVKLAGEEYYVQEIFDSAELIANLDRNAVAVKNSVYDHIIYDSGTESRFAQSLDNDPDVRKAVSIKRAKGGYFPNSHYCPQCGIVFGEFPAK